MTDSEGRLTLELEIVTPLFLGGAQPRTQAELRPASVRGALRTWWRAWHQAVNPSETPEKLFKAESEVFGSTATASSFAVRVSGKPRPLRRRRTRLQGRDYLLYGLYEHGQPGQTELVYRPALRPRERFGLTLITRPRHGERPPLDRGLLAALWLLCNLGGLGARTRRGTGAIRVVGHKGTWPEDLPPLDIGAQANSIRELKTALSQAMRILLRDHDPGAGPSLPIPSLGPQSMQLFTFDREWSMAEAALAEVGSTLQKFRNRYDVNHDPASDYFGVKEFISTGTPPATVKRAAFGLPLQFRYRSAQGTAIIDAQDPSGKHVRRLASPLHLRVIKLASAKHAVIALHFTGPLLPDGYKLRMRTDRHRGVADLPDHSIFDEYCQYLEKDGPVLLEVCYG